MKKYNVNDHAQHIFENQLDDFFNYLATQTDLSEALWCMFDEAKEYKNAACAAAIIKRNQWKQHIFRLLDNGNKHSWLLLTEYARSEHELSEWDHAASKADDLR